MPRHTPGPSAPLRSCATMLWTPGPKSAAPGPLPRRLSSAAASCCSCGPRSEDSRACWGVRARLRASRVMTLPALLRMPPYGLLIMHAGAIHSAVCCGGRRCHLDLDFEHFHNADGSVLPVRAAGCLCNFERQCSAGREAAPPLSAARAMWQLLQWHSDTRSFRAATVAFQ